MRLNQFNSLEHAQAIEMLSQCCAAQSWCEQLAKTRPIQFSHQLVARALAIWQSLDEADYLQAFEAHPMIGDMATLSEKYANTSDLAQGEQAGTELADKQVLEQLHQLNHQYLKQNGFIFIICASGLSAQAMLTQLQERIHHSREQEIEIAAQQQIKISLIRLQNLLTD
ncbi:2-oxo-4-hydroxy-4-carboxy-5-ureidoimidazoline decarboxylase [Aliiglaciecola sp. LCG003]|uniref:2-oxo-4-hydroxy-4-carboxy-5-ureidoimidazoline decarboxylase n=1 Tax=Aliiglaciecola sp. LCG003 TaxID=3053655 RepID=UPI0025730E74|nr:2-oxo-4-hydroxy-4-carboxy-5-ureidoimidazoline decarboxylase [Aliiglaciecola sp. LCG003]WJG11215.1 2-oxo-4-hydroxy-4-carboxy-5-ureidoimidazoline decarboxylase [Aliiglaciecola sp. LCG003]